MLRFPSWLVFPALLLLLAGRAAGGDPPRVLFLGDPIHQRMVTAAARELGGRVQIEFSGAGRAHDTGAALECLDELLGDGKWDLGYFNFGLGDLFHKDPRTRETRAMSKRAGGMRVTSPAQYGENLEKLVLRLKGTGARLIWASTTPLVNVNAFPSYQGNLYDAGSEAEYNAIAARVMVQHDVPVNDVHAWILSQFGPDGKHPGHTGYDKALAKKAPLHKPVAEAILRELK